MIPFLVASAAVGATAWLLAARLPDRGPLAFLLATALLAWTTILGNMAIAGLALRSLSGGTLVAVAIATLVVTAAALARFGGLPPVSRRLETGPAALSTIVAWPPAGVALGLVGLMLAWRTVLAIQLPVVDLLGLQYHLVFVDVWLQSDALVRVAQNQWTDGWPANVELVTTWLSAFTRTDAPAGLTSLLPIPVAIVAAAGLARTLGASRSTAGFGGLLFGITPAMVALSGSTYPDTAFAAAVVAAWWLGLRVLGGDAHPTTAGLFGMAAGLALGTKGSGFVLLTPIVAAVALWPLADAFRRRHRRDTSGFASALVRVGATLLPVLLLAGAWYAKNLVVHGNPLYPVGFGPFSGLAPGSYGAPPVPIELEGLPPWEQLLRSWVFDWARTDYPYNVRPGGFGHGWLATLGFAVAGAVILARTRRRAALTLVLLPASLALALLTSAWYARYTLVIVGLGCALMPVALTALAPRARSAAGGLLLGLATASLLLANAAPNIDVPIAGEGLERTAAYVRFVFGTPEDERRRIGNLEHCAAFEAIPAGDRVAVAKGFMVPHAVVGPRFERQLTAPLEAPRRLRELVSQLEDRRARWLVTIAGTSPDLLAASDPARFRFHASTCKDGNLWEVLP